MKCVDCGGDAVCITALGYQVCWAFCKKCVKKRMPKKMTMFNQINVEDLDKEVFPK